MDIASFLATVNNSGGVARQNKYEVYIYTDALVRSAAQINALNKAVIQFPDEAVDWMSEYLSFDMQDEAKALTAYCEKAELPSYQFGTESHRIYGPAFKIPHIPEYQDVTLTFMCGANMNERYFFDSWMYLVMDPLSNNFNYLGEYTCNIDIVQYQETSVLSNEAWYRAMKKPPSTFQTNLPYFNIPRKPPFLRIHPRAVEPSRDRARYRDSNGYPESNYYTTLIDAYPIAINTQDLAYDANDGTQKVQVTFTYKYAQPFDGRSSTTNFSARGERQRFDQTVTEN